MKRLFISCLILVNTADFVFAQDKQIVQTTNKDKGFYVRGGLGYAFPQAGGTYSPWTGIYSGTSTNPSSSSTYSFNIDKVSFSSGLHGYGALGYMFNKNVGVELAADFGIYNNEYDYAGANVSSSQAAAGVTLNVQLGQKAHYPVLLNPSLVLQTDGAIWNLYTRIGATLPLSARIDINEEHTYVSSGNMDVFKYTESIKTKFGLGFNAAAGISYKLSENTKFWGELSVLSLTAYADELDYLTATRNGADNYSNLTRTVIAFRSNGSAPDYMTYAIPFSNIALNAGISWSLSKRRKIS